jgi:hypothetical protein
VKRVLIAWSRCLGPRVTNSISRLRGKISSCNAMTRSVSYAKALRNSKGSALAEPGKRVQMVGDDRGSPLTGRTPGQALSDIVGCRLARHRPFSTVRCAGPTSCCVASSRNRSRASGGLRSLAKSKLRRRRSSPERGRAANALREGQLHARSGWQCSRLKRHSRPPPRGFTPAERCGHRFQIFRADLNIGLEQTAEGGCVICASERMGDHQGCERVHSPTRYGCRS